MNLTGAVYLSVLQPVKPQRAYPTGQICYGSVELTSTVMGHSSGLMVNRSVNAFLRPVFQRRRRPVRLVLDLHGQLEP